MKLPRRQFLHLAVAAAIPAALRPAIGANLSDSAGAHHRRFSGRGRERYSCAPDGAVAQRTAWPAVHHREPARRRRQYRNRVRGACGAGRPHAAAGGFDERDQRVALRQAQLHFPPRHRAGRQRRAHDRCHGGESVVSGQDDSRTSSPTPRPIRARSIWHPPATGLSVMSPGNCSS